MAEAFKFKRLLGLIAGAAAILLALFPSAAAAREGDCGYEGGISSGEVQGKTSFEYQEAVFITGEPIVFKGTLVIKKSQKKEDIVATYTYNLKNADRNATLVRALTYTTRLVEKENGQKIEETSLAKTPSEVIKIGNESYVLKNYDFTRSCIIDPKPAVKYFAGNTWGKKTYQTGAGASKGTVTVEVSGNFYGYDQYWGTAEAIALKYIIESEKKTAAGNTDKWGGAAEVSLSSTTAKRMKFVENEPLQISFEGGYVQTQNNCSVLEFSCSLPEFDSKGISTDRMITRKGSMQIETFPVQTRLPVPDVRQLRGHWCENDVRALYSLEIFKGGSDTFDPEQYITRAEFIAAFVEAAKEVPADPSLLKKTAASRGRTSSAGKKTVVVSPFSDVSAGHAYFTQIESAYKRGLVVGISSGRFMPNGALTLAEALTVFMRALGLESLAPAPHAATMFKDDGSIPDFARDAVCAAEKIGLVKGDGRGYLKPNEILTKGRAATLIRRFVDYMRDGIMKDYRDNFVNYR